MIDNALLEKIRNLEPADCLELIGVFGTHYRQAIYLLPMRKETYWTRVWPIWNQIQTIRARGQT